MKSRNEEIQIVRDLAKRYMEIAQSDRYVRMRQRFRDTNDLKPVRPPVIIEEIPWEQMNYEGALDCVCEDPELRGMEYGLRVALFRDRYFKCDNFAEPYWVVYKSYTKIQNDPPVREKIIQARHTSIVSHEYEDIFTDESVIEQFRDPVITAHPEQDGKNLAHVREILGDAMPVVLRGHTIYYAPWDVIVRLHGVENTLTDIYDNPEFLHKIIRRFTERMASEMDQMEAQHLYDPRIPSLHCTPGAVTVENPSPEGSYVCRDIWFRTMAQTFASISPAAHYEFDVQYSVPLASRCAYTYYGCCEPLHDRIDMIKKYPNLRKIGVSPWADVAASAEQIGGNYVFARKPNPANVALATDPEVVKRELLETVVQCQKYGCPFDYVLKDISTVNDRPENLILWAKTVSDVLDGFYGEA